MSGNLLYLYALAVECFSPSTKNHSTQSAFTAWHQWQESLTACKFHVHSSHTDEGNGPIPVITPNSSMILLHSPPNVRQISSSRASFYILRCVLFSNEDYDMTEIPRAFIIFSSYSRSFPSKLLARMHLTATYMQQSLSWLEGWHPRRKHKIYINNIPLLLHIRPTTALRDHDLNLLKIIEKHTKRYPQNLQTQPPDTDNLTLS